jgi:hypothetical protein
MYQLHRLPCRDLIEPNHTIGAKMKIFAAILLAADLFFAGYVQTTAESLTPNTGQTIYLPLVIKPETQVENAVENGNFEAGRTGWVEYEDSPFFNYPLIVRQNDLPPPISPYDGEWVAWLGGDSELISYIEQVVEIPNSNPVLVYWHWIDSIFGCDTSFGGVYLNNTLVDQYALCATTDTGGWIHRTIPINTYAGQMVTLRIYSQTGVGNFSSLYIDAVSIHTAP